MTLHCVRTLARASTSQQFIFWSPLRFQTRTLFWCRMPSEGVSLCVCLRECESVMLLIPTRPCVYEPTYTGVFRPLWTFCAKFNTTAVQTGREMRAHNTLPFSRATMNWWWSLGFASREFSPLCILKELTFAVLKENYILRPHSSTCIDASH